MLLENEGQESLRVLWRIALVVVKLEYFGLYCHMCNEVISFVSKVYKNLIVVLCIYL